jgi:hypothetical protein
LLLFILFFEAVVFFAKQLPEFGLILGLFSGFGVVMSATVCVAAQAATVAQRRRNG